MFSFATLFLFLIHCFWAVSFTAFALKHRFPTLLALSSYGKHAQSLRDHKNAFLRLLAHQWLSERVSFIAMYVCATCFSVFALTRRSEPTTILIFFHVARRALESLVLTEFSDRCMPLVQLVWAIGFYFCAVFGPWLQCVAPLRAPSASICVLVVGLEVIQMTAHWQLAAQRRAKKAVSRAAAPVYVIPRGLLFARTLNPHYLAEIVFYALLLCVGSWVCSSKVLLVAFVALNLTERALRTRRWYRKQFGPALPSNRAALIPFVL